MVILEEIFKWHLEAFASELFNCIWPKLVICTSYQQKIDYQNTEEIVFFCFVFSPPQLLEQTLQRSMVSNS